MVTVLRLETGSVPGMAKITVSLLDLIPKVPYCLFRGLDAAKLVLH